MLGRLGYFFICFLWLLQSSKVLAVSNDKKPILIICSYNPAAHQTSVTISDYMDEYSKLGGQRDIIIENMNCKSFSEAPLWSKMMTQILAKYQGEKHPAQIILLGQEAWAAYLSQRDEMQVKVPVMCSLASSNVVILPEDTVESLDSWMPESVDLFDDHLNIPELKSGFINQYDIDDSSLLSENETHCLYFGQHVWRSDHASIGAKRNEEIPRSGFDSDGWTETFYLYHR